MKTLIASALLAAAAVVAYGGARTLTGLESVIDPDDPTNGGFWDASGRASLTVQDSDYSATAAFDVSAKSQDFWSFDSLDVRAFAYGLSRAIKIRTDLVKGLILFVE